MKKVLFYIALQMSILPLFAQLTDDFSAATLNEQWLGDITNFTITAGELQSNDDITNVSALYAIAPTSLAETTNWEIFIRCEFDPSSSNFARIYLASNQPPVDGASLEGYFLKIGGISGADDAIELYRQDGTSTTLLLAGTIGAVAAEPALARIAVSRTSAGLWTLEADYTGGENFDSEGTVTDNTYSDGLYFGMLCKYTGTRGMSFFFDDVNVEPLVVDQDGPTLIAVVPQSPTTVQLTFNEPLATNTAETISNYTINQGIGAPLTATLDAMNNTKVNLTLGQALQNLTNYTLTVDNINDWSGNSSGLQALPFTFLFPEAAAPGDLVINEIMADPSPVVGLPNAEYIELYNASDKVLQLGGMGLVTSSTPKTINEAILLPNEYIVLCDLDNEAEFASYGKVATLNSFPALTNSGSSLALVDEDGEELAFVEYTDDWYQDVLKKEGGYSLELIAFDSPHDCPGNWRASDALEGGTPATENAVVGSALDNIAPILNNGFAGTTTEIVLQFNDVLGEEVENIDLYSISPTIGIGDVLLEVGKQSIRLFLESALAEGIIYTVSANSGMTDCLGNASSTNQSILLGLTIEPEPGDLIINEILFNPFTGGVDFLELYNSSDKILALKDIQLRNEAITSGTTSATIENEFTLLPGAYVVYTPDPAIIRSQYLIGNEGALLENKLPTLGDKFGNISVYNQSSELLDALDYTEDWHSALISDRNGVSLERLRADEPTQSQSNWHSAASIGDFAHGTPTFENSQNRTTVVVAEEDQVFFLPENTFSPDGDGYQDVLEVFYETDQLGYVAKIRIFDSRGREIIATLEGNLLGGKGSVLWDGSRSDGDRARIGIYVLHVELFTPDGDTKQEKLVCVLAGQLD